MTALDAAASAELDLLLQPTSEPALTADERVRVQTIAASYGLAMALYRGWTAKCAKAAPGVDVKAGDVSQSASQVYAHCIAQRDHWAVQAGVATVAATTRAGFRSVPSRRA
ncbi:hypothetical protein [uncultured Friedmanniella sp.]|uniref:hypothetical protein n=1 Tax=uncultured Friedmanniella sp. TaxID=335381 RepID=UPI0035CBE080